MRPTPLLRLACALTAVGLAACDTADVVERPVDLEVVYLPELRGDLPGARSAPGPSRSVSGDPIDLGEIRQTRDYYFLVRNRGTAPVNDVRVSVPGAPEGTTVSPSVLDEVPPFGSASVEEALASGIVRVTVEHGWDVMGGYAPPLAPGPHRLALRVATDGDGGTARVGLRLFARVADVSVFDAHGEVDLRASVGSVYVGGFEARTYLPNHYISGPTRIVNTGNVDVLVERFYFYNVGQPFMLAPGDEIEVQLDRGAYVAVSEADAVRDTKKLPIQANGKSYFALRR